MDNVQVCLQMEYLILLCVFVHSSIGHLFMMLSTDQTLVLNSGHQMALQCEFYMTEFDLFRHPVQWTKSQGNELSEINIMGNIKEPFKSTERFSVQYVEKPPRYTLLLFINNFSAVDSGNYTCHVRAQNAAELGSVHYTVYIREPVDDLFLIHGNKSHDDVTSGISHITALERDVVKLTCVSKGGSPPPDMGISIGRDDCTEKFVLKSKVTMSGALGFRIVKVTKSLVSNDFTLSLRDHGKHFKCKSKVKGLPPIVKSAQISVNYAPKTTCTSTEAMIGDRNIQLTCDIRARPPVTSWYWILNNNLTADSKGNFNNDRYRTVYSHRDGYLHVELYIRLVTIESFGTYSLFAENSVMPRIETVSLRKRDPETEPRRRASSHDSSATMDDDANLQPFRSASTKPTSLTWTLVSVIVNYFVLMCRHIGV